MMCCLAATQLHLAGLHRVTSHMAPMDLIWSYASDEVAHTSCTIGGKARVVASDATSSVAGLGR